MGLHTSSGQPDASPHTEKPPSQPISIRNPYLKPKKEQQQKETEQENEMSHPNEPVRDTLPRQQTEDRIGQRLASTEASAENQMLQNQTEQTESNFLLENNFYVGQVVEVQSRTWPGINKPGGTARIKKVFTEQFWEHTDGDGQTILTAVDNDTIKPCESAKLTSHVTHVDVQYVLGGREKKVSVEYVGSSEEMSEKRVTFGRCAVCGSLRIDCGSCDVLRIDPRDEAVQPSRTGRQQKQRPNPRRKQSLREEELEFCQEVDSEDESFDSDDEEVDSESEEMTLALLYKRTSKSRKESEDGDESVGGIAIRDDLAKNASEDNIPLARLKKQQQKESQNNSKNERQQKKSKQRRKGSTPCSLYSLPPPPGIDGQNDSSTSHLDKNKENGVHDKDLSNKDGVEEATEDAEMVSSDDDTEAGLLTPTEDFEFDGDFEGDGKDDGVMVKPRNEVDFEGDVESDNDNSCLHAEEDSDRSAPVADHQSESPRQRSNNETGSTDILRENADDNFIQGEGEVEAGMLPSDILDLTKDISYGKLPEFVDRLLFEIKEERLPRARQELSMLSGRFLSIKRGRQSIKSEQASEADLVALFDEGHELHSNFVMDLIKNGFDQCQKAMNRLDKERREKKGTLTETEKRQHRSSARELLSIRVEALNDEITEVDRGLNSLLKEISSMLTSCYPRTNDGVGTDDSSVGSTDFETSKIKRRRKRAEKDFDHHQYAYRKRKLVSSQSARQKRKTSERSNVNRGGRKQGPNQAVDIDTSMNVNIEFIGDSEEDDNEIGQYSKQRSRARNNKHPSNIFSNLKKSRHKTKRQNFQRQKKTQQQRLDFAPGTKGHGSERKDRSGSGRMNNSSHAPSQNGSHDLVEDTSGLEMNRSTAENIPTFLVAANLFRSMSSRGNSDIAVTDFPSDGDVILDNICHSLQDNYPQNLNACQQQMPKLKMLVTSMPRDFAKQGVSQIFWAMHTIFRVGKCSTMLDLFNSDPGTACFQIDCWCVIFILLQKKMHLKLDENDGLLHSIFSNITALRGYVLTQMIDVIYSQLQRDCWGRCQYILKEDEFKYLEDLRDQIGASSSILSLMYEVLVNKFESPRWFKSKLKENLFFVSAVDPQSHVDFITEGVSPKHSKINSRMKVIGRNISRKEIDSRWSIVGFFAHAPIASTGASDFTQASIILTSMIHYNCGVLPNMEPVPQSSSQKPPSQLQLDTCGDELKWIRSLVLSKSLGNPPHSSFDKFLTQLVQKATFLDSTRYNLNLLPTESSDKMGSVLARLWTTSSLSKSRIKPHSVLNDTFSSLDHLFHPHEAHTAWNLAPSTGLSRQCTAIISDYVGTLIPKKARFKCYMSRFLSPLVKEMMGKAKQIEEVPQMAANTREVDVFAAFSNNFSHAVYMEYMKTNFQIGSFFREKACFLLLACVVAGRSSDPSIQLDFALNKSTREKLWQYSSYGLSDCKNLCLVFLSAKIMSFTMLLHLHVEDFELDPHEMSRNLDIQLQTLGLDDDVEMLEFLATSISSSLQLTVDILESLNRQDPTVNSKGYFSVRKFCAEAIHRISMWLSLIFQRASFIIKSISGVQVGKKSAVLVTAIKKLGNSSVPAGLVKSLIQSLKVVVQITLHLSKSSEVKDFCIDSILGSSLCAIRSAIGLVNSCRSTVAVGEEPNRDPSSETWNEVISGFLSFMSLIVPPTRIGIAIEVERACKQQSHRICAVLAALCTICNKCEIFNLFHFRGSKNLSPDDQTYLRHLGISFCSELSELAVHFPHCAELACRQFEDVFYCLLIGLLDSEILFEFPTCNLSLITSIGGWDLKGKGDRILLSCQPSDSSVPMDDPDAEASNIKKASKTVPEPVGSSSMCTHIWSFCNNVGMIMMNWDKTNHRVQPTPQDYDWMKSIGSAIISICNERQKHDHLLNVVPKVSIERECLKRVIFFCTVFNQLKQNRSIGFECVPFQEEGLSNIVATSIIENLYLLSEVALSHQRQSIANSDLDFQQISTTTKQKAYTEFSGSLLALLLRKSVQWVDVSFLERVRDFIIVTCLRETESIGVSIEKISQEKNNCCLRKLSRSNIVQVSRKVNLSIDKDLLEAFVRRAGELLIHEAGRYIPEKQQPSLIIYSLIEAASSNNRKLEDLAVQNIGHWLTITPKKSLDIFKSSSDNLQGAIDLCLLLFDDEDDRDCIGQSSIHLLREWVISVLFVENIKKSTTTFRVKLVILKMLSSMLKSFATKKSERDKQPSAAKEDFASIATLAQVAHSLKSCLCDFLVSGALEDEVVSTIYSCTLDLFELTVADKKSENDPSLLCWVKSLSESETPTTHESYIFSFAKWAASFGRLLQSQITHKFLVEYVVSMKKTNQEKDVAAQTLQEETPEMKHFDSISIYLRKLDDGMFPQTVIARELNKYKSKTVQTINQKGVESIGSNSSEYYRTLSTSSIEAIEKLESMALNNFKRLSIVA